MNMSKKKNIKQELEDLDSPILAQWQGKAEEWSMPDGYLDGLVNDVVAKSEQPTMIKLFRFVNKKSWQIAASVLFLIAVSWFLINKEGSGNTLNTLASLNDISTEEIQTYVLDNIDEFELEMLEEYAFDNNDKLEIEDIWIEDQFDIDLF